MFKGTQITEIVAREKDNNLDIQRRPEKFKQLVSFFSFYSFCQYVRVRMVVGNRVAPIHLNIGTYVRVYDYHIAVSY